MRTHKIFNILVKLFLIAIMCALACALFSCKSKKKLVDKKLVKVSEIIEKDIKKTTKQQMDVSTEKIKEVGFFEISEKTNVNIDPVNNDEPITVVHDNDTLTVYNGKLNISNENSTKTAHNTTTTKTTDKSETKIHLKDKTETKITNETKQKSKNKEVKGGFPWWILAVVGVVFIVWKASRKIPGI